MRLAHPFITRTFNYELYDAFECTVMEYVPGTNLHVRRQTTGIGRLDEAEAVGFAIDVLTALDYAHEQGVVHNDIKPRNLLIGEADRIKVCDFGIARAITRPLSIAKTQAVAGTVAFMSPERIGGEHADGRSDLYALGATLFNLIDGRPPFGTRADEAFHGHLHEAVPRSQFMSDEVDAVVRRAMAKDPDERFATASDMREFLWSSGSTAATR